MFDFKRPTFKNLFDKEEIVVVKRGYRNLYRLNWRRLFTNMYNLIAFWKPKRSRVILNTITPIQIDDEIALIKPQVVDYSVNGPNKLQE